VSDRVGSAVFSIDISGVRELAQDFGGTAAVRIVMDELVTAGQRSGKHARDRANALLKHQSGKLGKSARISTRASGSAVNTVVEWTAVHAQWVEFGRGPVVAKRAKYLHFFIDGQEFFRKRVGPAKAQKFTERGLQAAEALIVAEHQRAVDRAAAKLEAL
jgi:hypothetical protein